jgi:hypothetical protein
MQRMAKKRMRAMAWFMLLGVMPGWSQEKPKVSVDPLSADQQVLYRSFLSSYENDSKQVVNLADKTLAFYADDMDKNSCLKDLLVLDPEKQSLHGIPKELLPKRHKFRLVDREDQAAKVRENDPSRAIQDGKPIAAAVSAGFSARMLTLSEVMFSADHHYAAFQYSFDCGSLCGHGSTLIYEQKDGHWMLSPRKHCGHWIS